MNAPGGPYHVPLFFVRQGITLTVNRYEIHGATRDGQEGPLLAVAQQKRLKFKEEVTFYTDESRPRGVLDHGPPGSRRARRARRVRRVRPADRLVQEGVRCQPAALDVAAHRTGAGRPRAGAVPADRGPAPGVDLPAGGGGRVGAVRLPLRLRRRADRPGRCCPASAARRCATGTW